MKTDLNQISLLTKFDGFSQRNIKRANQIKRLLNSNKGSIDFTNTDSSKLFSSRDSSSNIQLTNHRSSNSMNVIPPAKIKERSSILEYPISNDDNLFSLENSPNKEMIDNNAKEMFLDKQRYGTMKNNLIIRNNSLNNATNSYLLALGDNNQVYNENQANFTIEEEKSEMITDSEATNKKRNYLQSSKKKVDFVGDANNNAKNRNLSSIDKNLNKLFFNTIKKDEASLVKVFEGLMNKKINKDKTNKELIKTHKQTLLNNYYQISVDSIDDKKISSNGSTTLFPSKIIFHLNKEKKTNPLSIGKETEFNINQTSLSSFREIKKMNKNVSIDIPKERPLKALLPKSNLVPFTTTRNKIQNAKTTNSQNNRTNTISNTSVNTRSDSIPSHHRNHSKSQSSVPLVDTQGNRIKKIKSHSIFNINNLVSQPRLNCSNVKAVQNLLLSKLIKFPKPNYQQEALNKLKGTKGKVFAIYIDCIIQKIEKKEYVFKGLFQYFDDKKLLIRLLGSNDCPTILTENKIKKVLVETSKESFEERDGIYKSKDKAIIILKKYYTK